MMRPYSSASASPGSPCGQIQWELPSVEGPKGFPAGGPRDGLICAGGNQRFAELDDPRGGAWHASRVSAGASLTA